MNRWLSKTPTEGYQIAIVPVWQLVDQQGSLIELSTEPRKASDRRPRSCVLTKGWKEMADMSVNLSASEQPPLTLTQNI